MARITPTPIRADPAAAAGTVHAPEDSGPSGAVRCQTLQVMSAPQHSGDLIFPCPLGHWETSTSAPASVTITASTRGASQVPQVVFTDIPHLSQT